MAGMPPWSRQYPRHQRDGPERMYNGYHNDGWSRRHHTWTGYHLPPITIPTAGGRAASASYPGGSYYDAPSYYDAYTYGDMYELHMYGPNRPLYAFGPQRPITSLMSPWNTWTPTSYDEWMDYVSDSYLNFVGRHVRGDPTWRCFERNIRSIPPSSFGSWCKDCSSYHPEDRSNVHHLFLEQFRYPVRHQIYQPPGWPFAANGGGWNNSNSNSGGGVDQVDGFVQPEPFHDPYVSNGPLIVPLLQNNGQTRTKLRGDAPEFIPYRRRVSLVHPRPQPAMTLEEKIKLWVERGSI